MTDLNIHLAIIDPVLEVQVMRVLAESGIQCAGRHFTLAEIHIDERKATTKMDCTRKQNPQVQYV